MLPELRRSPSHTKSASRRLLEMMRQTRKLVAQVHPAATMSSRAGSSAGPKSGKCPRLQPNHHNRCKLSPRETKKRKKMRMRTTSDSFTVFSRSRTDEVVRVPRAHNLTEVKKKSQVSVLFKLHVFKSTMTY